MVNQAQVFIEELELTEEKTIDKVVVFSADRMEMHWNFKEDFIY